MVALKLRRACVYLEVWWLEGPAAWSFSREEPPSCISPNDASGVSGFVGGHRLLVFWSFRNPEFKPPAFAEWGLCRKLAQIRICSLIQVESLSLGPMSQADQNGVLLGSLQNHRRKGTQTKTTPIEQDQTIHATQCLLRFAGLLQSKGGKRAPTLQGIAGHTAVGLEHFQPQEPFCLLSTSSSSEF